MARAHWQGWHLRDNATCGHCSPTTLDHHNPHAHPLPHPIAETNACFVSRCPAHTSPPSPPTQVKYCKGVYGYLVPNTRTYSWTTPTSIDDTALYRVSINNPARRLEATSSVFNINPYLRPVSTE